MYYVNRLRTQVILSSTCPLYKKNFLGSSVIGKLEPFLTEVDISDKRKSLFSPKLRFFTLIITIVQID